MHTKNCLDFEVNKKNTRNEERQYTVYVLLAYGTCISQLDQETIHGLVAISWKNYTTSFYMFNNLYDIQLNDQGVKTPKWKYFMAKQQR